MLKETMSAIQVNQYGGPEVMMLNRVEVPVPKAGEVTVQIHYATVMPIDYKIRNGWLQQVYPKTFPYVPGNVAAGVIHSVGSSVTQWIPGDRVFGVVNGGYAEYATAEVNRLFPLPDSLSFEQAATILGGADSAWKALFTEGEMEAGQTVLIHAAAGGVGQFAIQLAKWKGAKVIGTASARNLDFIKSLGADVVIDYETSRFEEIARDVDLVVDTVGKDTEDRSWSVLKRGGRLVSLVQPPNQNQAELHGIKAMFNSKFPTPEDLVLIVELVANQTIKPAIDRIYPLSEAVQALTRSENRHGRGRILLSTL